MASGMTGIQDAETAQLLDTVDKLRSLGSLSQDISLPQIIVVGQQSSGKSSVLEAISGIPFPVNDGLCTQFATEVILRRSQQTKRSASINAINPSDARATLRHEFAVKWKGFEAGDVGRIITEAKECMSLGNQDISHDKLRLEICGPEQDHLTLVDLPGLIVNPRLSQSVDTVESIRKLVISYARQPLSTILAVISGGAEFENQGILGLLKKLDGGNKAKRTFGVLTQPDSVHAGTEKEKIFLALAENQEWPLPLGWHVLRNLSSTERQEGKDRAAIEKEFFENATPWANLPPEHVGVNKLKKRLSKILLSEIASQLGNILDRIEKVISTTALALDKLGEERSTSEQQRSFLIKIGEQYKHLMSCALEGEYSNTFFHHYAHRLRARIANENIKFASSMLNRGHRWNIKATATTSMSDKGLFKSATDANVRAQLIDHVQELQKSYRGNELHGMFPANLVDRLFKEQACNWHDIAFNHVNTVFKFVKDFLGDLLHYIGGEKVAFTLLEHLVDPDMDHKERLIREKIDELLYPYLVAHPMTLNTRYIALLNERRKWQPSPSVFDQTSPNIDMLACEQIVDIMVSYYDIALSVFTDNIATLAIERCLLSSLPQLISPIKIASESNERLALLGSESVEMISERQRLRRKLEDYKEGQKTIRQHIQRHVRYTSHTNENLGSSETTSDPQVEQPDTETSSNSSSSTQSLSQQTFEKSTVSSAPVPAKELDRNSSSSLNVSTQIVSTSSPGLYGHPNHTVPVTTPVHVKPENKPPGFSFGTATSSTPGVLSTTVEPSLFGQPVKVVSSATSTPAFGSSKAGSLFGNPTTSSAFGSSTPAPSTGESIFGGSVFGGSTTNVTKTNLIPGQGSSVPGGFGQFGMPPQK